MATDNALVSYRPGEDQTRAKGDVPLPRSAFMDALKQDVFGPRQGGAIVLVDAEDARKGVGKTSCAVAIGKILSGEFGYEITEDDLVLGGEAYLQRLKDHPGHDQPSVVVWDEAVGAGSGDARRSMAEQNRVMGQAWQMMRTKRIVSVSTLPDWGDLDVRLRKLADFRVWCRRKPIGRAKAYQVGTEFQDGDLRTEGLGDGDHPENIAFPNMDAVEDGLYDALTEKKDKLINSSGSFDADEILGGDEGEEKGDDNSPDLDTILWERDVENALRAVKPWVEGRGISQKEAADIVDKSQGWVSKRVKEWRDGKHRDLVAEGGD